MDGSALGWVDFLTVRALALVLEREVLVPKAYPLEFRRDVVAVARKGEESVILDRRRISGSVRRVCITG